MMEYEFTELIGLDNWKKIKPIILDNPTNPATMDTGTTKE